QGQRTLSQALLCEARCFGDDDVDHAESAAGRNFKTNIEVAALTLNNIRHNFADSFRLNRAHRFRSVCRIADGPIYKPAYHAHARVEQIPATRPHLNSLPQFSTSQC